jgi:hypothetical protein
MLPERRKGEDERGPGRRLLAECVDDAKDHFARLIKQHSPTPQVKRPWWWFWRR